jgi:Flp pilus assembly protein TadD
MQNDLARLQRSPHEVNRWLKAKQQLSAGRTGLALAAYRELVKGFPGLPRLWFELGIAAAGELDFTLANDAFRKAAELGANDAPLLVELGQQYHRLRRLAEARACCERAVALHPSSLPARTNLAVWLEIEHRLDDAWACIEVCVAQHPRDLLALYLRAFLLHRKGRNAEAETALRDLLKLDSPEPKMKYSIRHLLGVVLDQLGQYTEAIRWLREAKALVPLMSDTAAMQKLYDQKVSERRALLASLTPETIKCWRDDGSVLPAQYRLAFLGGHPRSGTTLVEQVLGAHPAIQAFDESEAFPREIEGNLLPSQPGKTLTLAALNAVTKDARANLCRRYLDSLLREVDGKTPAQVLVDKNPSPTESLHLWLRVFPDLKVIIPLRDPRDVVISCFFLNLVATAGNVNFLSLERAAINYADMMDVWLRMRELGGFDWLETRYEDMVANLESEGRRITEFLGLAWHPNQAKFHETAGCKFISAPTYSDVTKPVYKKAVGRWHHYAEALEPIQSRLAKYCETFGYAL